MEADSDVIEVETNKAVMGVTSPCTGSLSQILVEEGQSYPVGAILAIRRSLCGRGPPPGARMKKASPEPLAGRSCERRPDSSRAPGSG